MFPNRNIRSYFISITYFNDNKADFNNVIFILMCLLKIKEVLRMHLYVRTKISLALSVLCINLLRNFDV